MIGGDTDISRLRALLFRADADIVRLRALLFRADADTCRPRGHGARALSEIQCVIPPNSRVCISFTQARSESTVVANVSLFRSIGHPCNMQESARDVSLIRLTSHFPDLHSLRAP